MIINRPHSWYLRFFSFLFSFFHFSIYKISEFRSTIKNMNNKRKWIIRKTKKYLASNHSSLPPYERRQEQRRSIRRLQYNDLWPSYCPHRIVQKRSYQVERSGRTGRIWYYPWYRVQDPWEQPEARTFHRKLRCSRHWSAPVEDPQRRHLYTSPWGPRRARRKWLPRIWIRFGCRIGLLECVRSLSFISNGKETKRKWIEDLERERERDDMIWRRLRFKRGWERIGGSRARK